MPPVFSTQIIRPAIRHFSANRPRPDSRLSRAIAMACIASGVILPFIPPAIESSRIRKSGVPSNKTLPPLCFHAR
ncbi:hypothetical protein N7493_010271 [Penicillium malachiteum]|uniref:Uncharacterized protein n=1 Tax=Penicillium malachiteum TaxID=1324776 RepID=A0AAD6MRC2_9EURO|nr:hypothetical protein N7493_010271 [Penicillium malachiteum]